MSTIIEGIKFAGGLAGLASLSWNIFESFRAYLKIKVEVKAENGFFSVLTEIENLIKWKGKKIDNAFLIISPENLDIMEAGRLIGQYLKIPPMEIQETGDFGKFSDHAPFYVGNRVGFIPLPFYYEENIDIGDEKLTYRCSIDNHQLANGIYSVRLFIYGEGRLHRSTQDLLNISTP